MSYKILLNAAKCQGNRFYRFWRKINGVRSPSHPEFANFRVRMVLLQFGFHTICFFFICMNLFFLGSRLFCLYYFSYIRTPPAAANIECIKCINVFILKLIINCMLLPYYHWPVWLNGWVFVYELSGCGFESRCYHLNFRYGTGFKQGVLWHSGKL